MSSSNYGGVTIELIFSVIATLLISHLISRTRRIPKGLCLPPGPPGKLLVGNTFDVPSHHSWETYTRWAKKYGDLVSIEAMQQKILFVNSADIAHDLFDRRSSIYSDRFSAPMLMELMGADWITSMMQYGQRWRQHRRLLHQHFHPKVSTAFHGIHTTQTQVLLRHILETPQNFMEHFRLWAVATIIKIVYGIEVLTPNHPYIKAIEDAVVGIEKAGNPGAFLVDILPILKHVPEWVPGASFRRKARIWRGQITKYAILPFDDVKRAFNDGTVQPSMVASLLASAEKRGYSEYTEEMILEIAATAYMGGSDTTVSVMGSLVLAMVLYPECQRKAQSELDSLIGMDRLPTFEDRDSLPYVNAMCKELLRWNPVVPLAIAHRVMQDDVYGEYFIPGGSIVIGNTWAILHDERTYGPEPDKFRPERFFQPGVKDPVSAFGFGRRICPGRYVADDSVFIAVASILKAFDISPARDEHGNQIPVEPAYTSGLVSYVVAPTKTLVYVVG